GTERTAQMKERKCSVRGRESGQNTSPAPKQKKRASIAPQQKSGRHSPNHPRIGSAPAPSSGWPTKPHQNGEISTTHPKKAPTEEAPQVLVSKVMITSRIKRRRQIHWRNSSLPILGPQSRTPARKIVARASGASCSCSKASASPSTAPSPYSSAIPKASPQTIAEDYATKSK